MHTQPAAFPRLVACIQAAQAGTVPYAHFARVAALVAAADPACEALLRDLLAEVWVPWPVETAVTAVVADAMCTVRDEHVAVGALLALRA